MAVIVVAVGLCAWVVDIFMVVIVVAVGPLVWVVDIEEDPSLPLSKA